MKKIISGDGLREPLKSYIPTNLCIRIYDDLSKGFLIKEFSRKCEVL